MKKLQISIVLLLGVGAITWVFYKNDRTIRSYLDNFISGFYAEDIVSEDTVIIQPEEIARKYDRTDPVKLKKKVLKPGPFQHLDDYAKNTPSLNEDEIEELATYLIQPARNDLEKVRLIFSWVAFHVQYDDQAYNNGTYGAVSPEGVLKSKAAVCEGYSVLFQALCESANLEAEKISGYAKGYGYITGEKMQESNHVWNAVKVNGIWKLFDVTWASGYGTEVNGKLVSHSKFDDYWFDTPPEEFIFSHFPEEPEWQFNTPRLTLNQYFEMPYINNSFFELGFSANYILKNTLNNNYGDIADTYALDYPVKILSGPCFKELSSTNELEFLMESEYAEEIAAVNNGKWIDFKKDGDNFNVKFKPEPGNLEISVKFHEQDRNYNTCVKYKVM